MAEKGFLDDAYELDGVENTRDFYADWAATYDREVAANGYVTPGRCAQAVAKFAKSDAAVLDVGCGTGLSGLALARAGFTTIDGCDLTPEMLEKARAHDGLYRNLWIADPKGPLDLSRGPYGVIAAIGAIGIGAAPVDLFYDITKQMARGSHFVFSLNDHTLEQPGYIGAVMNCLDCGGYELLFKEHGDHLPGRNMKSTVYVLRKR